VSRRDEKIAELVELVGGHAPLEGANPTAIPELALFRGSSRHKPEPYLYETFAIFLVQGHKRIALDSKVYDYHAGRFLTTLAPMPLVCECIDASKEKPMLAIAIKLEQHRILSILTRIEQAEATPTPDDVRMPSGIFTAPITDELLDACGRLLRTLDSPAEAAIVGEAAVDEIYFRILKHERGGALPHLLTQRGQFQQIARAVQHVHQNLADVVSVDELASLVHMSNSAFHKKFKEVMHQSPLQYAKQVKLTRAQALILEGLRVSEAGYSVGYNSPAQFSREFKRYFGVLPSDARAG